MGTKFLDSKFSDFIFHKQALNEEGEDFNTYNYYLFIHPKGQVLMMRENVSTGECLYANGGYNSSTAWTNRATLEYMDYDQLA